MVLNMQVIQMLLVTVFTPALMSPMGDTLAAILAQDGFPQLLNDVIAWFTLIAFAVGSVFAVNLFYPSIPAFLYAVIPAIFLIANTVTGKLRPYLVGLDWIQSNFFDVAKGGTPAVANLDVVRGLAALLPAIEGIIQRNATQTVSQNAQKLPAVKATPTRPEPKPIQLGGPMQWDNTPQQAFPGIQNVGNPLAGMTAVQNSQYSQNAPTGFSEPVQQGQISQLPTSPVPALHVVPDTSNIVQFPNPVRHFGDSQVIPAVGPQTVQG